MAEKVREPSIPRRGGELRNRLRSLYRARCQKERGEPPTLPKILLHFKRQSLKAFAAATLPVRPSFP